MISQWIELCLGMRQGAVPPYASPLSVALSFTFQRLLLYTQSVVRVLYLVRVLYSVRRDRDYTQCAVRGP